MDFAKTYAKRLQAFRIVASLSQSGLAAKSGVSLWAIQSYEHGRNVPSLETAVKLARALGQPLEAFLPSDAADAGPDKPRDRPRQQPDGQSPPVSPKSRKRKSKPSAGG